MRIEFQKICLRKLRPGDEQFLLDWENSNLSHNGQVRSEPYSLDEMKHYIKSVRDVYLDQQLRFIVEEQSSKRPVGAVDLFDVNFNERMAHVAVLIAETKDRRKGYAADALDCLVDYSFSVINLNTLKASVQAHNTASKNLFSKMNFKMTDSRADVLTFVRERHA